MLLYIFATGSDTNTGQYQCPHASHVCCCARLTGPERSGKAGTFQRMEHGMPWSCLLMGVIKYIILDKYRASLIFRLIDQVMDSSMNQLIFWYFKRKKINKQKQTKTKKDATKTGGQNTFHVWSLLLLHFSKCNTCE